MDDSSGKLGIVAGAGELPIAIAKIAREQGRQLFVVAVEGLAREADVRPLPHAFVSVGEIGKTIRLLKDAACDEVTIAGRVARPDFAKLRVDARGALAIPRLIAATARGDDALLRALLGILEAEGLRVVGSADCAAALLAPAGCMGEFEPIEEEEADIRQAILVIAAMGALDIGQAAVVCRGLVLAVEAAEGTDAMLMRVAELPLALRGLPEDRKGVLVKAVKPNQERRIDLPVIGNRTVELAAAAGLSGIAVQAGASLIVNRKATIEAADRAGIFVFGFAPEDYPRG